jgi:pimeloyl-ACP methyl ester carboxylesterase
MPRRHSLAEFTDVFSQAMFHRQRYSRRNSSRYAVATVATVGLIVATALVNRHLARKAERDNPPAGQFLDVDGVRLHYVEHGEGEPLVLLHGNGSMIQDFGSSGLVSMARKKYRVIAFDRPGFGHSSRPRGRLWTPQAQADLIHEALRQMSVNRAMVLGHSWGASVAAALALRHPETVSGLVLASGYYFPTVRADVVMLSGPALPIIGDVLSYTLAPLISRAVWPLLMRKIFGPAPIPEKFSGFPKEMAVRPSQIRASAAETAFMIPNAMVEREEYQALKMPVAIIAGQDDRLIPIDEQSDRLHAEIAQSTLHRIAGAGHMVHQTAPAAVMAAIEQVDAVRNLRRPEEHRAKIA